MLAKGFGIIIAFPSTTILLTNSCTSVRVLGTLNGFATAFSGLGRALGPLTTGLIFSWGADHGYILAPYAFLALVAAVGAIPVFMIVEGDGPAVPEPAESESESDESAVVDEEAAIDDAPAENEPLLANQGTTYGSAR